MKNSSIAASLIITFLATIFYIPSVMAVDLQDTLVNAYQNNKQLKAQQSDLLATQEQIPQAYSGFMPQVVFQGDIKSGDSYNLLTQGLGRGALYHRDHSRDFILTQPLFNGGQTIEQVRRAYNSVAAATSSLATVEEQVLINAISTHMDVVKANEVVNLSRVNENVLKEQLDSAQQRFKLGEATRTDVSQSEARYARAISDRTKAEGDLEDALANYKNLTGLDEKMVLDSNGFVKPYVDNVPLPESMEAAMDKAFKNNPSLVSQVYQEKASENDVGIAYGYFSPSVSLRAMSAHETDSYSAADIHDNENILELDLTIPLYQGGNEYSRVRQAKRTRETRKYQIDQRKDQLRANITKSWDDILTTRAVIKSNTTAVHSATTALEGVKQEQQVGSRTILDVLDAEQELYQAKINLASAEHDAVVAVYNLKFYIGELTAKDLALPVKDFEAERHLGNTQFKMIGF